MLHWQVHFWSTRGWAVRHNDLPWPLACNIGNALNGIGWHVRLYNWHTGDEVRIR